MLGHNLLSTQSLKVFRRSYRFYCFMTHRATCGYYRIKSPLMINIDISSVVRKNNLGEKIDIFSFS